MAMTAEQKRALAVARARRRRAQAIEKDDDSGSWGEVARQFGDRFTRGLYGMANLPTSLANAATGLAGVDYQFKRPLEAAAPGVDAAIMNVDEARGPGARLAGTVGEFMGANALPGMGMIAAAPRLAAATQGATGLGGQSVNRVARGVAAAPGTAASGEVLASVGSGVGASLAEGQGANAEYLASVAGGLVAPMAVAVAPTNLARKGIGAARRRLSPEELGRQQREQVVAGIRENMSPDAEAAVAATLDIQRSVPDYRPSVAEATEHPSFIATQREFEGNLSGPDLDQAIRRYGDNERAIGRSVRDLAPQSPLDIDAAMRVGRERIGGIGKRLDQQIGVLDRRQADIGNSLQAGQRQRELGSSIRNDLIGRRATLKEEMTFTAREMGLNDPDARFPFSTIRQRLIEVAQPRSQFADRAALPSDIIADLRNAPETVSIVDLMALRSRITDDLREAARLPTGDKRIPYLQAMKTELDAVTDQVVRSVGDPDLADNMQRFRRMYLEDYIQPFEQGAAARVLKTDATGSYTVPDEKVAKEFFGGWNQTAADQFRRIFPNSASASAAMEAAALDDLYSAALRDGVINPAQVDAWSRKNAGVLKDFPRIANRVRNVSQALDNISRRRATITARKKQAESSVLAREIARIENASATPETVVQQAIRNPARMAKLINGLKTTQAKDAVARQVWDHALSSPNPAAFLKDNQDSIIRALGSRYQTATRLARAIEKNRLVPRPAGRALDTNPMASVENLLGTGLNQVSSRIFAVKSGRTSARYALADLAGRAFRNMTGRQARETLQQALYDPQVARDLANAIEFNLVGEPAVKRLYTFLISNGIAASGDEPEGTDDATR